MSMYKVQDTSRGEKEKLTAEGDEEAFWGDGNILYFSWGGGYRSVCGLPWGSLGGLVPGPNQDTKICDAQFPYIKWWAFVFNLPTSFCIL